MYLHFGLDLCLENQDEVDEAVVGLEHNKDQSVPGFNEFWAETSSLRFRTIFDKDQTDGDKVASFFARWSVLKQPTAYTLVRCSQ